MKKRLIAAAAASLLAALTLIGSGASAQAGTSWEVRGPGQYGTSWE